MSLRFWSNDTLPAETGFDRLLEADQVFFQNINALLQNIDSSSDKVLLRQGSIFYEFRRADLLHPNQRVAEYERYLRQSGYVPVRVDDDVNVYSMQCRP